MWNFRFTLRATDNGATAEIFGTVPEATQFADEAFKAGWDKFYQGGYSKTFEVVSATVARV